MPPGTEPGFRSVAERGPQVLHVGHVALQQGVALLAATGVLVTTVGELEGLRTRAELLGCGAQVGLRDIHGVPLGAFRAVLREIRRMPGILAGAHRDDEAAYVAGVAQVRLGGLDAPLEMRHEAGALAGAHVPHGFDDRALVLGVEGVEARRRREQFLANSELGLAPAPQGFGFLLRDLRLPQMIVRGNAEGRV